MFILCWGGWIVVTIFMFDELNVLLLRLSYYWLRCLYLLWRILFFIENVISSMRWCCECEFSVGIVHMYGNELAMSFGMFFLSKKIYLGGWVPHHNFTPLQHPGVSPIGLSSWVPSSCFNFKWCAGVLRNTSQKD